MFNFLILIAMRNEKKNKNVMSTLTDIMAYTGGILSSILFIKWLLS